MPAAAGPGYRIASGEGAETVVSEGRMRTSVPAMGYLRGYDPARGRFWMANTKTRTFWQGTVEEYCADAQKKQDAMLERHMANMSPAQRRLMEQYKKDEANPEAKPAAPSAVKVTIERTEERSTIAGQPVRKVRVLADGQPFEELWLTTDPALARSIDYAKVREIDRRVQDCVGGALQAQQEREMEKIMETMPEYARRSMDPTGAREKLRLGKAVRSTSEYASLSREGVPLPPNLTSIEPRDIPAAELEPPSGYRAAAPDEVMGAPR